MSGPSESAGSSPTASFSPSPSASLRPALPARRGFLARIAALGAALGAGGLALPLGAQSAAGRQDGQKSRSELDAWMDRVPGHHRQLFHAVAVGDISMLMAKNFLDTYREAYGLPVGDVGAVVGMHGPALTIALADGAWEKHEFGRAHSITDPGTREPARRNIYRAGSDLSVESLQGRGVVFVLCNTALRLRSAAIAQSSGERPEQVYEELRGMILPGIVLVPALVVAIARAQERGFTYLRAS